MRWRGSYTDIWLLSWAIQEQAPRQPVWMRVEPLCTPGRASARKPNMILCQLVYTHWVRMTKMTDMRGLLSCYAQMER